METPGLVGRIPITLLQDIMPAVTTPRRCPFSSVIISQHVTAIRIQEPRRFSRHDFYEKKLFEDSVLSNRGICWALIKAKPCHVVQISSSIQLNQHFNRILFLDLY